MKPSPKSSNLKRKGETTSDVGAGLAKTHALTEIDFRSPALALMYLTYVPDSAHLHPNSLKAEQQTPSGKMKASNLSEKILSKSHPASLYSF